MTKKSKNTIPEGWKLLFIELVSIRKEKLLDISEEDAKREGFKNIVGFLDTFYKINKHNIGKEQVKEIYNPDAWVLEFKVVK